MNSVFIWEESQNKDETQGLVQDLNRKGLPQGKRNETLRAF